MNYNCCYWDRFDELAIKKRQIKNCGHSNRQRQTFRKNIQSIEKVIWMKTSHDRNCFFKTFFFQPCKVKYYGFQGSVICLIFAILPFLAPISTVTCIQVNNYEIVVIFFHISHNLTGYSAIVHLFTKNYPVCWTYVLRNNSCKFV